MNTSFNNLDELIKFLFETANSDFPYTGKAYLKDEEIEFTGEYFEPDYFVISPFYPRTLFIIDGFVDSDDRFSVGIMMYYGRWDEFPAVHLPSKYLEEVIDRLQGFPRKENFREAPEEPIP